jgi:hypothetical protein
MAKEKTPLDEMIENYYHVRYSYFHSRTPEQLRRYGVRVTGDHNIDATTTKEMVDTFLNIESIFKLFKEGVTILVVNYNDTAEIYRIVQSHLTIWKSYMTTGVHGAPQEVLEDLVDMDLFASKIYDKAANVFSENERKRLLNPNIPFTQKINITNILTTSRAGEITEVRVDSTGKQHFTRVPTPEKKANTIVPRAGYNELFAQHLRATGGWKRDGS